MSTASHFETKRADANEKYMGFAAQPAGGGVINILTGLDLKSDVQPNQSAQVFQKRPLFTNSCNDCSKTNLSGFSNLSGFKNFDFGSFLNSGLDAYSSYNESQTAQAAADIERARAQQAAEAVKKQAAQDSGVVSIVKSYTIPIIIVGVLGISGMIAYFYFRKKK